MGCLSEHPFVILSGDQHSALVVVTCCYSFEHISHNLHLGSLYLVHDRYLAYLDLPAWAGCGLDMVAWPPLCLGVICMSLGCGPSWQSLFHWLSGCRGSILDLSHYYAYLLLCGSQLGCQPVSGVLLDFANSCTAQCLCLGRFVRTPSCHSGRWSTFCSGCCCHLLLFTGA